MKFRLFKYASRLSKLKKLMIISLNKGRGEGMGQGNWKMHVNVERLKRKGAYFVKAVKGHLNTGSGKKLIGQA